MSYIYLMESIRDYDVIYKIGYSSKPTQRLKTIQTGNDGDVKILETFETKHGRKLETSMHNFFSHKRKNKEWFNLDLNDIIQFIPMCKQIENNLDYLNNFKY